MSVSVVALPEFLKRLCRVSRALPEESKLLRLSFALVSVFDGFDGSSPDFVPGHANQMRTNTAKPKKTCVNRCLFISANEDFQDLNQGSSIHFFHPCMDDATYRC